MTESGTHKFHLGQTCIFTNRGTSGIKDNDHKRCKIVRLKPRDEWVDDVPAYVIEFLDGGGFGAKETELKQDKEEESKI